MKASRGAPPTLAEHERTRFLKTADVTTSRCGVPFIILTVDVDARRGQVAVPNGIELHHVRDTLGHATIATTSIYVHGEDDARHAAVSSAHRITW
jgi:hypothetical protein